ncbi:MAG: hypothetical protein ABSG91_13045 [Syntrophobacteraceae bacterium]
MGPPAGIATRRAPLARLAPGAAKSTLSRLLAGGGTAGRDCHMKSAACPARAGGGGGHTVPAACRRWDRRPGS